MEVTEIYVASDGEPVKLSVNVKTPEGTREAAEREARRYFHRFGYRVVEDAKAKGVWPLPSDHPNA